MFYLYSGYLIVHFFAVIKVFQQSNMPVSAIIFSLVVFIIWSSVPIVGYIVAKAIGAKGELPHYVLFTCGIVLGLMEKGLFHFQVLSHDQSNIGTFIVWVMFFIIAYLSVPKSAPKWLTYIKIRDPSRKEKA